VLVGQKAVSGKETWLIHVQHPGVVAPNTGKVDYVGSTMDLYVDPTVNFLVRRVECHVKGAPGPSGPTDHTYALEAVSFREFRKGEFLPTLIVSEFTDGTGERRPDAESRIVVTKAVVNEALPSDALDFRFPEHVLVTEWPQTPGKYLAYVIGPNGQVVDTIDSPEEYREMQKAAQVKESTAAIFSTKSLVVAVGFVLVLLTAAVISSYLRRIRLRPSR
jgi:hypothetical protein